MKVSVICTNYNKGEWIGRALDGIMTQECPFDFEVIVVDDASTDNSPQVIRTFAERHPQTMKVFTNPVNQGITKTWIAACEHATGDYVARCDGDDYWIDPHKLYKQVEALEHAIGSRWCSTDFDIVDVHGEIVGESALANGLLPRMGCFEDMLALKGMTMSSTWLVGRELIQEVNRVISPDAIDDTFNIQLELFMRTKLTMLGDSTAAYRIADESDSHTIDHQKMANRIERLEQTQLEYLAKNADNMDWPKLARLLISENGIREVMLCQRDADLRNLKEHLSAVEADREGLRMENERLYNELSSEIEKLRAENTRIYSELSGMAKDLMRQLQTAEAERDELRESYQAIVSSKRWQLASKAASLLKKNG